MKRCVLLWRRAPPFTRKVAPTHAKNRYEMLDATHMLCRERQQGHDASALERDGEPTLVLGARSGLAPWLDLATVRQETPESLCIFIIDFAHVVNTELAHLAARAIFATRARGMGTL